MRAARWCEQITPRISRRGKQHAVETNRGRTEGFSLIFETGEEIASVLQQFSKNQKLAGSSFKAIGALSYAKLGWLNSQTNQYDPACVPGEQLELLSLIGDITLIVLGPPRGGGITNAFLDPRLQRRRQFARRFQSPGFERRTRR
jgi:hypothetical protein